MQLDSQNRALIEQNLALIAALLQRSPEQHLPTLIQGNAGISLFFAYLAHYQPGEAPLEACVAHLEQAIARVSTTDQTPFLATGFTGLSWLVAHLIGQGILEPETTELLDDIRPLVVKSVTDGPMSTSYDLLYGYIGASLFLAETPDADCAATQQKLLRRVARAAVQVPGGVAWISSSDATDPSFNLGLAHGVPGIVVWLLQLHRQGHAPGQCEQLIEQAISFVLAQGKVAGLSVFPTSVGGEKPLLESRLAWCHGDIGIALMLVLAGRQLDRPAWRDKGVAVARRAATRDLAQAGVHLTDTAPDLGICHGISGIALLFLRLYQLTGDPVLGERARYWLGLTLAHLPAQLAALSENFFIQEFDGQSPELEQRYGLLEGIAGIGLVLLAFANPRQVEWARLLLLAA
ncbi:lanthionine synthetase C family protein [Hymenobacter actinosclerus]|uniref:Lanthionine synthetase C-like protein n=1 Tax=Hymenobacter actinosclerus TaxID=82805 RepID=A0A1I0IP48_9BACT|nr:lanthionine synthetase C family protein [Hymenobacter actinosclerus]SET98863.1 Lanthionine synthetase C-like protein [Hymenobacter actinosclerus]